MSLKQSLICYLEMDIYPLFFIQYQIRKFLNNKQSNINSNSNYRPCPYQCCIFFKLSYIGSTSLQVEKELRSFFQRKLQNKIKFVFIHNTFKLGNLFSHKDKQATLRRSNVVWVFPCQTSWTLQLDPFQICSKCVEMFYGIIDLDTENFSSISLVLLKI